MEKKLRTQAVAAKGKMPAGSQGETSVSRLIEAFNARVEQNTRLTGATKERTLNRVKALVKTWPDLPARDIRRLTGPDCRTWAAHALRNGTGFIATNAMTKRQGMAPSSFNKCVDVLRRILEIAREQGYLYDNQTRGEHTAPAL